MTAILGGWCSQTTLPLASSSSRRFGPWPYSKNISRWRTGDSAATQSNDESIAITAPAMMQFEHFITDHKRMRVRLSSSTIKRKLRKFVNPMELAAGEQRRQI